jgi:hypothetical protein
MGIKKKFLIVIALLFLIVECDFNSKTPKIESCIIKYEIIRPHVPSPDVVKIQLILNDSLYPIIKNINFDSLTINNSVYKKYNIKYGMVFQKTIDSLNLIIITGQTTFFRKLEYNFDLDIITEEIKKDLSITFYLKENNKSIIYPCK